MKSGEIESWIEDTNKRFADYNETILKLKQIICILIRISQETEDFWPYTSREEQQICAELDDNTPMVELNENQG